MTREEAVTVLKAFMENPLFSDAHKQAFNIAIHDIKQRHDWDINKLMLVPKTEWEQEPTTNKNLGVDCNNCKNNFHRGDGTSYCATGDGMCHYECEEPITKNDLGVDCISRQIISDYVESHIQEINTGYGDLNRHTNSILRMIVNYIENMPSVTPQEPRWIPVSEKYPKPEDEYKLFLVTDEEGVISVQTFYMSIEKEPQPYFSGMVNVIAWMPLPKAYR